MKLIKNAHNPILCPLPGSSWENFSTCNPGAWFDGQKVFLLYRAAPDSDMHPIYLGLAESADGVHFRRVSKEPVFAPSRDGFDGGCVEDPRIIQFGDIYFVTYAARMFPPGAYWENNGTPYHHNSLLSDEMPVAAFENLTRTGLAATKDFHTWHRLGPITPATVDDRDVIIFPEKINGQFVMLHRPATWVGNGYNCEKPSIWISFAEDMLNWGEDYLLAQPVFEWEAGRIGGNTPPIKTRKGWLILYHGVDAQGVYRVGAMMLDLNNPRKILGRIPKPILEPEEDYEKKGIMPNVVFPCGNVVIGDELFVYYGGADTCCCVATCRLGELVDYVLSHPDNFL